MIILHVHAYLDELVVNVAEQNLDCMEVVSQGQNIGFMCSYSLQDMKNMQG